MELQELVSNLVYLFYHMGCLSSTNRVVQEGKGSLFIT
jgi:hypothetical protein